LDGYSDRVISLYFHIPFCSKKCPYCHFYSIPNRPSLITLLQSSLMIEWQRQLPKLAGKTILSIYFGGGTPTLLPPRDLAAILQTVFSSGLQIDPNCEITIEANPEKIDLPRLIQLKQLGINRISIGVQSLDDSSLQVLDRIHSAQRAHDAVMDASKAGFENISIDLMYDLPWQTESSWQSTLDHLSELPITHCSLYNLTIEPHTLFFQKKEALQKAMPDPDRSLKLLQMGIDRLESLGLHRYEISAFAKNGMHSSHNTGYWTARPFLGFGPSAFSYWEESRFKNVANLNRYARALSNGQSTIDFTEKLSYPANINELLAIRLRLLDGVKESEWTLPRKTIANLEKLQNDGLVAHQKQIWKLTDRGLLFYDYIAENLI
jgi:oxygen-independent coproporphyrinogen III oxidase